MIAHRDYLREAVDLATESVKRGGGPFGAVVEIGGRTYAATNSVTLDNDPTAHAEVNAIRAAAAAEGFDLSGAILYSSCSPCPMCLAAAMWARVSEVRWAASTEQASAAGFDDGPFHEAFRSGSFPHVRLLPDQLPPHEANEPFEEWQRHADSRIDY